MSAIRWRVMTVCLAAVLMVVAPACSGGSGKVNLASDVGAVADGSSGADARGGHADVSPLDTGGDEMISDAGSDVIGPTDAKSDIAVGWILRGHLVPSGGVSMSPNFELKGEIALGLWPGGLKSTSYRLRLVPATGRSRN